MWAASIPRSVARGRRAARTSRSTCSSPSAVNLPWFRYSWLATEHVPRICPLIRGGSRGPKRSSLSGRDWTVRNCLPGCFGSRCPGNFAGRATAPSLRLLARGLLLLLKAVGRDPVAPVYKLAERARAFLSVGDQDPVLGAISNSSMMFPRRRTPTLEPTGAAIATPQGPAFFALSPAPSPTKGSASSPFLGRYASYAAFASEEQGARISSVRDA